jgi:ankyrin repeat protein
MPSYEESGIIALGQLIGVDQVDKIDDLHLINAVKKGDFDRVEELLKENKLLKEENKLLKEENKLLKEENKLLKENKENPTLDLDYQDSIGATALFYAASKGYDKIVEALIANGANKDIANYDGQSPFLEACSNGNLLVVEQLVNAGVDVNKAKGDGFYESYSLARFSDTVKKGVVGTTPLHAASTAGHHLVVRELLRLGADVEGLEGEQSPLWFASGLGNHEVIQELINSGADVNKAIPGSPSPLFLASQNGFDLVVNELISSGADVNNAFNGVMPIYKACEKNRIKIVKALFNAGADVSCLQGVDWSREQTNFVADGEMLKLLDEITNQENIDERDAKLALIIIATKNNNIDEVTEILKKGVGVNYQDEFGATALFYAAERGYDKIAQALIEKGANLDLATKDGATPLFEACVNNHNDIAKALFKAGADVGCLQESGWLYGTKLKEELELVGDEMKQLIKEFINPKNNVDPSEGIALSPRNLPGRVSH